MFIILFIIKEKRNDNKTYNTIHKCGVGKISCFFLKKSIVLLCLLIKITVIM